MDYVIATQRLGLRNWKTSDEEPFVAMGKDSEVMHHFPKLLSGEETIGLIRRLQNHFSEYGYCYFAVEVLETGEFIGFTGLANQTWESEYTPCVDLGWRLKRSAWGKGYATEAAKASLNAAFQQFDLKEVYAFATDTNHPSMHIMEKIGMEYIGKVQHPLIEGDSRFMHCVVYNKTKENYELFR